MFYIYNGNELWAVKLPGRRKIMKRLIAICLALVLVFSLAACTKGGGGTDAKKGSVYFLNFKPEADEAWQAIAKSYTELDRASRDNLNLFLRKLAEVNLRAALE